MTDLDRYLQDDDKPAVYERREAARIEREAKAAEDKARRERAPIPVGVGRVYAP